MYKIAVIGPESTGKSVLTKALALHYSAPHVDEYARSYVEQLERPYTYEDVCAIARYQVEAENRIEQKEMRSAATTTKTKFIFFDTDLIITKVWFDYCYKTVPSFVNEQLSKGFFDLYLLCDTDLPWEPDLVREHGDDREFFFDWYRREIEQLSKPYVVVQGLGDSRLQSAIQAIELHFRL